LATAGCSFAIDIPAASAAMENAFTSRAFAFSRIDRSQFQLSKLRSVPPKSSCPKKIEDSESLAAKRCKSESVIAKMFLRRSTSTTRLRKAEEPLLVRELQASRDLAQWARMKSLM